MSCNALILTLCIAAERIDALCSFPYHSFYCWSPMEKSGMTILPDLGGWEILHMYTVGKASSRYETCSMISDPIQLQLWIERSVTHVNHSSLIHLSQPFLCARPIKNGIIRFKGTQTPPRQICRWGHSWLKLPHCSYNRIEISPDQSDNGHCKPLEGYWYLILS